MEKRRSNYSSQPLCTNQAAKDVTMEDKLITQINDVSKKNDNEVVKNEAPKKEDNDPDKADEQKPNVIQRKSHLEPGPYHADINNATFFINAEEGYEVIGMQMDVFDDSGNKDSLQKFYNLTTEGSVLFMRGELHKVGIQIGNRKDFSKAPEKLKGLEVDIILNFNDKGFAVIYFVGLRNKGKKRFDPDSVWK